MRYINNPKDDRFIKNGHLFYRQYKCLSEKYIYRGKLIFATRQQAADSTRNTTKRSNTVAEIQFFRYKFCSIDNSRSIAASAVGLYFNRSVIREFQTK